MSQRPDRKIITVKRPATHTAKKFQELLDLIARLRSPDGCPWDRSRTQGDIGHYLIEEAYEVLESLDAASPQGLKEELGDLLFQILFLTRMAEESGDFDLEGVLGAITDKMIRRHPHVFGDVRVDSVEQVRQNWERIKQEEKHEDKDPSSLLEGIPHGLSALARTERITARASDIGFDWRNAEEVLKKLEEEIAEFRHALKAQTPERIREEVGDLLFTVVNLCRFAHADAEASLRASLNKFTERFAYIEQELAARGKNPVDSSLAEMDRLWNEAKQKGLPPKR
jgi:tetrapyrrole methylase family protein / MazG family protein